MLQPSREYVIGCGQECDVQIPESDRISRKHLKLSFDALGNIWNIQDLSGNGSAVIDNQTITYAPIRKKACVKIADTVILTLTPEAEAVAAPTMHSPPVSSSATYSTNTVRNHGFREAVAPSQHSLGTIQPDSSLKVLSWNQYVTGQVAKHEGITKIATRFALLTGLRNTPWVRRYGQTGFESFDGYIIPDFKGNVETVVATIEQQIGQLQQYEDTDCYVANLTDAHIADSATQRFLGVEFFPIRRDRSEKQLSRGDYRRFCVVAYHRVRSYLLIEKYGSDLFVSWITRYEPQPTPVLITLWLVLAGFTTLMLLGTGNVGLFIMPSAIWLEIYCIVPSIMEDRNILPKRANARFLIGLIVIPTVLLLLTIAGSIAAARVKSNLGL